MGDEIMLSEDEIRETREMLMYWRKVQKSEPPESSPVQGQITRFYSALQAIDGISRVPKSAPGAAAIRSLLTLCRGALDEIEKTVGHEWQ